MSFKIGSKYEETKRRLKEEIARGIAKIGSADNTIFQEHGAQCYFCRKPIKGNILLVLDEFLESTSSIPIDEECFIESRFRLHYN